MIIYQHDEHGYFTGASKDVHEMQAIPYRWSKVAMNSIPEGKFAKLNGTRWDMVDEKIYPPPPVPQVVTKRQAKQQLLIAGLLSMVQPAIDAIEDATERAMVQIYWDDSQEFERQHPQLIALATGALGLTDEQLDALFLAASSL